MDAPVQIIINIGPDSDPSLVSLVTTLVAEAGDGATIVQTSTGVPAEAPPTTLDGKWLDAVLIGECAAATGFSKNILTRAVNAFSRTSEVRITADQANENSTLPSVLSTARVIGRRGNAGIINAADFVRLARLPEVRSALRLTADFYGSSSEEASLALADWLVETYGQLTE